MCRGITPARLPNLAGPSDLHLRLRLIYPLETSESPEFPFLVHPHMLRHACGYKLANDGRDTRALQHYLGHKNIMHTVRYTELSPERFKNFWKD